MNLRNESQTVNRYIAYIIIPLLFITKPRSRSEEKLHFSLFQSSRCCWRLSTCDASFVLCWRVKYRVCVYIYVSGFYRSAMLFAPAEAWPVSITSLSSSSNKNSNTSPCANISSLYIVLETSNRWKVEGHQFETVTLFCWVLSLDRNKRESLALAQKLLGTKQPKLPLHTCHLFRTWNLALTFLHAALTDMCRYARTAFVVRLFFFSCP